MTDIAGAPTPGRTRVLFIAGAGRSGSTLLATLLGEVEGWFVAGEVRYLWERGILENRLCGCGRPFAECELWRDIVYTASGVTAFDPARVNRWIHAATRLRNAPALLLGRHFASVSPGDALARELARTYAAIADITGARVIVDSSKLPTYAHLLEKVPEIDLRVLHLVRDPRAVAHSWTRRKDQPDRGRPGLMEMRGPARSALLWDVWNTYTEHLAGELGRRYLRVRYEDFTDDPAGVVRQALELAGEVRLEPPVGEGGTATLSVNHTVAGNPDRLRAGAVVIRPDDRWRRDAPGRDVALVDMLSAPLLGRHGYSFGRGQTEIGIQHLGTARRTAQRIRRHLAWGNGQGWGRLFEEDEASPADRLGSAYRRWRWRWTNPIPTGTSRPVYLVGLQRSGTNMVARALAASPEFEVRNENDRACFDRFRLRPDAVLRAQVERSGHRFFLVKPLIDSHRVADLLDGLGTPTAGRAIWAYRSVDGRVRSALAKFGDNNLQVMRAIAAGRGDHLWQAQRLGGPVLAAIRELDYRTMTAPTAAALLWYARNSLYFDLGLDRRDDVLLLGYEQLVAAPEAELHRVCSFLGAEFLPEMAAGIDARAAAPRPVEIDPAVRRLCDALTARLLAAVGERVSA